VTRIKYRDDMTDTERAQFCAELEAIDSAYTRASAEERRTRLIFNLVRCLTGAMESAEADAATDTWWYCEAREVLTEAEAMGYPNITDEDAEQAADELRKAALSRGQP
jgi:hypothetical protein